MKPTSNKNENADNHISKNKIYKSWVKVLS